MQRDDDCAEANAREAPQDRAEDRSGVRALQPLAGQPPRLFAAAVNTPEYLTS